jgi:hypothetical protein
MMKNKITQDVILQRLEDKGIKDINELDTDEQLSAVLNHFEAEITHDFMEGQIKFYEETTADGYSVYVATEDTNNVSICDDVFYYESERFSKLEDAVIDGLTIYIDEYDMGDYGLQDQIERLYQRYYRDMIAEVEQDLIEEGYEQVK